MREGKRERERERKREREKEKERERRSGYILVLHVSKGWEMTLLNSPAVALPSIVWYNSLFSISSLEKKGFASWSTSWLPNTVEKIQLLLAQGQVNKFEMMNNFARTLVVTWRNTKKDREVIHTNIQLLVMPDFYSSIFTPWRYLGSIRTPIYCIHLISMTR